MEKQNLKNGSIHSTKPTIHVFVVLYIATEVQKLNMFIYWKLLQKLRGFDLSVLFSEVTTDLLLKYSTIFDAITQWLDTDQIYTVIRFV